jgi:RNA polymerase sigma-70 factor (ECF subfamily)
MSDTPLELDRLLAEAAWLRRLAVHLVGDTEADDVVQEAWVAALRVPGTAVLVSPRAWLAKVVQRVAAGRHRSAARRSDRELARCAHPGPPESGAADDITARLELQRVVGEELDRLPEPYRSALFRQYYEGLSPQEIAARSGEPAGTVRWRTKRGRELLREALVARDGRAWEAWALALTPFTGIAPALTAPVPLAASSVAVAAMSKWISLSAVAGVLAALGLRVTLQAIDSRPASDESRVDATRPGVDAHAASAGTRTSDGSHTPMGTRAVAEVAHTGPVLGRGRLRSNTTGSLDEAELALVAADGRVVEAFVTGSAWAAPDLAHGRWRLEAVAKGHLVTTNEVDVPNSAIWTHDIELVRTGVLPVRIEGPDGSDLSTSIADSVGGLLSQLTVYASDVPIPAIVPLGAEAWPASPAGRWTLRDTWRSTMPHLDPRFQGELALTAPPPLHVALVLGRDVVARGTAGTGDSTLGFRIDEALVGAKMGSIEITAVEDSSGAPAACSGDFERVDGYGRARSMHRSGAALRAGYVPAGDYLLSLGGQWAPVSARITVLPGERTVLRDVRLRATTRSIDVHIAGLPDEVSVRRDSTLEVRASMPGLGTPFESEWVAGSLRDAGTFRLWTAPLGEVEVRLRLPGDRRLVFPTRRIEAGRVLELTFAAGRLEEDAR